MRRASCLIFAFCACLVVGAEPPVEPPFEDIQRISSWLESCYLVDVDTSSLVATVEIESEGDPPVPRIVILEYRRQEPGLSAHSEPLVSVAFFYRGPKLMGIYAKGTLVRGIDGSQLADAERRKRRDRAVEAVQRLMGWGPVVSAEPMGEHGEYELVWFAAVDQPPCEHLDAARRAKIDSATGILLTAGFM
jgi:hypothetical protein